MVDARCSEAGLPVAWGMPPDMPLVSVALCTWNGAEWLRAQLDSILAQQDVRLEMVALDDASSDASLDILREYAARDPRLRVHANERNLGHLRSFEKCMAMCAGDFIAPADQDDVWAPGKLRRLMDAIGEADLAYCDSAYIDGDGRATGRRVSDDLPMHRGHAPLRYVFQNTVSGHAALLRREVLADALPFPPLLFHDWWLAIRAAAGRGVVYVDEPLVQFRRHAQNSSAMGKARANADRSRAQRRQARLANASNRKWVAMRAHVARQYAARPWHDHARAGDWADLFEQALGGQHPRLWPLIWRDRADLPPWSGSPAWNALQFYFRCRRKFRRMRAEGEPTAPIFTE